MTKRRPSAPIQPQPWPAVFAGLMGAWLGVSLLKFGDPVVFDSMISPPADAGEMLALSWPVSWSYGVFAGLAVVGLATLRRWPARIPWLAWLPLAWLSWELLAATQSVDGRLTAVTIKHFLLCDLCFFLALLVLVKARPPVFWTGLTVGFLAVIWIGFGQHYGGLEATRKLFYEQPNWQHFPPEYLKRIRSTRIFSTLVYPNALAGLVLLLLPPTVVGLWRACRRWSFMARSVAVGLFAYAGLACLVWSGSKSGWLIALALAWIAAWRLPLGRRLKLGLVAVALVLGFAAFFLRYGGYFERGATSAVARLNYWQAALTLVRQHPILGTGPGTFGVVYRQIKPPQAEMAHLTHNDYLEQACDSGIPGFLAYAGLWAGSLIYLYRKSRVRFGLFRFAVWLGLLGWALHALVEFGLYIPASSWTAFTILGAQLGPDTPENEIDTSTRDR